MGELSLYAVVGLCIGFLWGIGCSLAILYSIYLGGYRKAVEDSLLDSKPPRFVQALKRIYARRESKAKAAHPPPETGERGTQGSEDVQSLLQNSQASGPRHS